MLHLLPPPLPFPEYVWLSGEPVHLGTEPIGSGGERQTHHPPLSCCVTLLPGPTPSLSGHHWLLCSANWNLCGGQTTHEVRGCRANTGFGVGHRGPVWGPDSSRCQLCDLGHLICQMQTVTLTVTAAGTSSILPAHHTLLSGLDPHHLIPPLEQHWAGRNVISLLQMRSLEAQGVMACVQDHPARKR